MTPYAGFDMPVEYTGITDEHLAVRTRAGLFDVSHMGQIEIAGKEAVAAVQRMSCNDASRLQQGHAQYSGLLTPSGTFVDDIVVYRLGPSHFMLVVNAANVAKDYAWIVDQAQGGGRRGRGGHEQPLRADCPAGSGGGRDAAAVVTRGRRARAVLRLHLRGSGQRAGADLAHRLHRRGRLRDLRAAEHGRPRVAGAARVGLRRGRGAVRPRRARHAAARGRDAPLRQRHRRHHHAGRGRPELDCRLAQAVVRRRGPAAAAEGAGAGAAAGRVRADRARHRPPGPRRGAGRRARRARDQRHADAVPEEGRGHGLRAAGPGGGGHGARHRHPRPRHAGRGREAAVLQARRRQAGA